MEYLVDTHCHLHDPEFFSREQAEEFLGLSAKNNVKQVICIGTSEEDSLVAKEFSERHEGVFWTFGIHPENAKSEKELDIDRKKAGLDRGAAGFNLKLVAIGEVGLDYHYSGYNREAQIRLFEKMLQLARDLDLPVSFHVREAFADFFPVVDNFSGVRGVVHSFTDNKKTLKKVLERGFYVGVNGLATYSTLPTPPLERMLLETDAPFLTPEPNRGKINMSGYVKDIAEFIANKLGVDKDEVRERTTRNARELFKLSGAVIGGGE